MKLNESILKNLTESFPVDFKEFFKDCTTFEELDDKVESDYPNEEDKEWVIDTIDDYADETYRMDNCDDEVWIIKPRDFEDIKVINAYTEATCCGCKANLTQEDIGKLIAMNFGYDHDWCGIYKVDEYLNSIKNQYERYEKRMEENANA